MSEPERTVKTCAITEAASPTGSENADRVCQGSWRLKSTVLLREEDGGVILFEPESDSVSVANATGGALLRWRRNRICYDEWCEALRTHYAGQTDSTQIEADVKNFLERISHFLEPDDDQGG